MTGNRAVLTVIVLFGIFVVTGVLIGTGVIYVGPGSSLTTLLGSGMFSGLLTLITVTLSINQLILSRVFGSPSDLSNRLEGSLDFRRTVEKTVNVPTSPNQPGGFLALVGGELETRTAKLERIVTQADVGFREEVTGHTSDLVKYAERLGEAEETQNTFELLYMLLGSEYADHIDAMRTLRAKYGDQLPREAYAHLEAIIELLKAVAIIRQFFKTLVIQQDLATLSRRLIYTGTVAALLTYFLTTVYTSSSSLPTAVPPAYMPLVITVATPFLFAPLVVLVVSLLRVATVTLYTVSVGFFVPPEERIDTTGT